MCFFSFLPCTPRGREIGTHLDYAMAKLGGDKYIQDVYESADSNRDKGIDQQRAMSAQWLNGKSGAQMKAIHQKDKRVAAQAIAYLKQDIIEHADDPAYCQKQFDQLQAIRESLRGLR